MKQIADTHYKNFSPGERIALFYEAMARRDLDEADRLIDTCPTKSYRCMDTAYGEGVRMVYEACFCVRLMIEEANSRMLLCGALMSAHRDDEAAFDKFADSYVDVAARIKGYWDAWLEFCAQAGVEPEAVMRATWHGLPKAIESPLIPELADDLHGHEAYATAKASALSLLNSRWNTYCERTGPRYNKPTGHA